MGCDAILGNHCWFLLLTIWALSIGASQVSPDEWKHMLLIPCNTLILVIMATLFMKSLSNDRRGLGKMLTGIQGMCHPINLTTKIFLFWDHPLMNIYTTQIFLCFCPFRISIHIPLNFLVTNFPNYLPSKFLTICFLQLIISKVCILVRVLQRNRNNWT